MHILNDSNPIYFSGHDWRETERLRTKTFQKVGSLMTLVKSPFAVSQTTWHSVVIIPQPCSQSQKVLLSTRTLFALHTLSNVKWTVVYGPCENPSNQMSQISTMFQFQFSLPQVEAFFLRKERKNITKNVQAGSRPLLQRICWQRSLWKAEGVDLAREAV